MDEVLAIQEDEQFTVEKVINISSCNKQGTFHPQTIYFFLQCSFCCFKCNNLTVKETTHLKEAHII